jgi:hypothetical protein
VCAVVGLYLTFCFSVVQQPNSGLGRLTVEVSRSHTPIHLVGLPSTSDKVVAEAATYKTHNRYKRRTSVLLAGIEPATPAVMRLETYDLDRTATGIGGILLY